jgi:nicotinamide riboside transporter PnuC
MWDTIVRYYFIDWIALVLNAFAIYLLGKKKKVGFALGIVANVAWIIFGILAHSMATVVACTIFVLLNIKGWWNWTREQASVKAGVDDDTPNS